MCIHWLVAASGCGFELQSGQVCGPCIMCCVRKLHVSFHAFLILLTSGHMPTVCVVCHNVSLVSISSWHVSHMHMHVLYIHMHLQYMYMCICVRTHTDKPPHKQGESKVVVYYSRTSGLKRNGFHLDVIAFKNYVPVYNSYLNI